ncbi:MAG: hypothetical protein IPI79_03185 [Moraxellaceae bacterium]|nr:hypothetical protein [Moraxellaceae bacterium]
MTFAHAQTLDYPIHQRLNAQGEFIGSLAQHYNKLTYGLKPTNTYGVPAFLTNALLPYNVQANLAPMPVV